MVASAPSQRSSDVAGAPSLSNLGTAGAPSRTKSLGSAGAPSVRNMGTGGVNPLQADPELKKLLASCKQIGSTGEFNAWRKSFLVRVDEILSNDGASVERATQAYARVTEEMDHFGRKVLTLQQFIKNGNITLANTTVRGKKALGELKDGCSSAMFQLIEWMPAVKKDEEKLGYSKWQLGAVLVRNGFEVYETMVLCRDTLHDARKECLDMIADRQTLDAIDYYARQIDRFCSVMSDLGLMDLM